MFLAMSSREKGGVSVQEMAFMRDLKRRRQSYRGIHTAKKSYIEVSKFFLGITIFTRFSQLHYCSHVPHNPLFPALTVSVKVLREVIEHHTALLNQSADSDQ